MLQDCKWTRNIILLRRKTTTTTRMMVCCTDRQGSRGPLRSKCGCLHRETDLFGVYDESDDPNDPDDLGPVAATCLLSRMSCTQLNRDINYKYLKDVHVRPALAASRFWLVDCNCLCLWHIAGQSDLR